MAQGGPMAMIGSNHRTGFRLLTLAAMLVGATGLARGQGDRPVPPRPVAPPMAAPAAIVPTAPVAPAPAPAWSGELGASGHPLMQASAIRTAAANFDSCLESLWPLAAKRHVSRASFDKYVGGLTPDLRIMDLVDAQPEFTKAFWDYLDILVNDARVANGREILARHKATFDAVEKAYGVDRYIITAIWGVEFELRHARRRSAGAALDRDAGLRRPAAGLFPRRVSLGAGNPAPRRSAAGAAQGLMGRRIRSDAIHADLVQALCRRFRRRRAARRRRTRPRI